MNTQTIRHNKTTKAFVGGFTVEHNDTVKEYAIRIDKSKISKSELHRFLNFILKTTETTIYCLDHGYTVFIDQKQIEYQLV